MTNLWRQYEDSIVESARKAHTLCIYKAQKTPRLFLYTKSTSPLTNKSQSYSRLLYISQTDGYK